MARSSPANWRGGRIDHAPLLEQIECLSIAGRDAQSVSGADMGANLNARFDRKLERMEHGVLPFPILTTRGPWPCRGAESLEGNPGKNAEICDVATHTRSP